MLAGRRATGARSRATVIAVGCVVVFGIATAGLVVVGNLRPAPSDTLSAVSFAIWTVLALGCGIGCALAARVGLFAITIPKDILRVGASLAIQLTVIVIVLVPAGIGAARARG